MASKPSSVNGDDTRDLSEEPGAEAPNGIQDGGSGGRRAASKKPIRTLTAAQLEKKRANDREAQRAIRERTKQQIETLERRIKELESGQAYQQLQDVMKQKQIVEAENQDLRSRLSSIFEVLRPLFPAGQLPDIGPPPPRTETLHHPSVPLNNYSPNKRRHSPYGPGESHSAHYGSHEENSNASSSSWPRPRAALGSPPRRPWEELSVIPGHQLTQPHRSTDGAGDPKAVLPAHASGGALNSLPKRQMGSYEDAKNTHLPPPPIPSEPIAPSIFSAVPVNIHPTCQYDSIIYDFIMEGRRKVTEGASLDEILGGIEPSMTLLVEPRSERRNPYFQFSDTLINLTKGFNAVHGLSEKAGVVHNLFTFLQWMVYPSKETWDAMPPYMYPCEAQLKIPHPMWVDHLPWPRLRHKMVYQYPSVPLANFFYPYTISLRIAIGGQDGQSCIYRDTSGEWRLLPEAKEKLWKLESFSVGREFAQAHPGLSEACIDRDD